MGDVNELQALQASLRGAGQSAEALRDLTGRIEAMDPHGDLSEGELEDLRRLTAANAVAAQAVRGLVYTMLKRRGLVQEIAALATDGEE